MILRSDCVDKTIQKALTIKRLYRESYFSIDVVLFGNLY